MWEMIVMVILYLKYIIHDLGYRRIAYDLIAKLSKIPWEFSDFFRFKRNPLVSQVFQEIDNV